MSTFGVALREAIDSRGRVCVGIDPHAQLLAQWGLADSAAGARDFGLRTIEAVAGHVAAVKPQVAFYERHGSAGIAALEDVIAAARAAGVLCIVDAKRGDIGSTMQGYADAFLREGSSLAGDSVTLSPYLGFDSLTPALDLAQEQGKGVFVLCLTSNPEGASVQLARTGNADAPSVASAMAAGAARFNAAAAARGELGSIGLVIGATIGDAAREGGVDLSAVNGPLLVPGIGAQGGTPASVRDVVGESSWRNVLASTSRAVLGAGPDVAALREAAQRTMTEME